MRYGLTDRFRLRTAEGVFKFFLPEKLKCSFQPENHRWLQHRNTQRTDVFESRAVIPRMLLIFRKVTWTCYVLNVAYQRDATGIKRHIKTGSPVVQSSPKDVRDSIDCDPQHTHTHTCKSTTNSHLFILAPSQRQIAL